MTVGDLLVDTAAVIAGHQLLLLVMKHYYPKHQSEINTHQTHTETSTFKGWFNLLAVYAYHDPSLSLYVQHNSVFNLLYKIHK